MVKLNLNNLDLRKKTLAGYLAVIFLIVIVGIISIVQSGSLGKKVGYLTNEVSSKVKLAGEIESTILSMQTSVEKFIYQNREEDNRAAEENIEKVIEIIAKAEEKIKNPQQAKIVKKISDLTYDYIDKYRKVVIRYKSLNDTKASLATAGNKIQKELEGIDQVNYGNITKSFLSTRIEVKGFMADYDYLYSSRAKQRMRETMEMAAKVKKKQFEDINYAIEDFNDEFEGFVSISSKMDKEVKKTILPLAPLIIEQAQKISSSGWEEMDASRTEVEQKISNTKTAIISIVIFAIIMGVVIGFLSANQIIGPISKVVTGLKDIAEGEGDLTYRLEFKSKDEIGELAKWFNTFIEKLQGIMKDISGNADTLDKSSSDLSGLSGQMSSGADNMSSKSNTVATAAEEMSANITSVASAMGEAANNVGMVATSAEEMTSVINEIAQNSEKARSITNKAVSQAKNASAKVDELGNAAQDISKVTETISEISEQVNLLALNATIEAARAGEAGKGFAVVANEIKELAKQTAEATGEIKSKIEGIQTSTEGTVTEIAEISKVINDVNDMVASIATAVEEQSATTNEIAGNVTQASRGIQEVTENVTQSSTVTGEIAKDISDVNHSAGEMSESSSQVNKSADELLQLAEQLKGMVGKFKV